MFGRNLPTLKPHFHDMEIDIESLCTSTIVVSVSVILLKLHSWTLAVAMAASGDLGSPRLEDVGWILPVSLHSSPHKVLHMARKPARLSIVIPLKVRKWSRLLPRFLALHFCSTDLEQRDLEGCDEAFLSSASAQQRFSTETLHS